MFLHLCHSTIVMNEAYSFLLESIITQRLVLKIISNLMSFFVNFLLTTYFAVFFTPCFFTLFLRGGLSSLVILFSSLWKVSELSHGFLMNFKTNFFSKFY